MPNFPFGSRFGGNSGSAFGVPKQNGGFGSNLGTFLAGAMLWNIASNIRGSNYQVYHNSPRQTYQDPSGKNQYNITHDFGKPNEAKLEVDFGNMSCITIYNAEKFADWANTTISKIESETNQSFPFGNVNLNDSAVNFNFTIEPGRIVHNETVSVTCCGAEKGIVNFEDILSGKYSRTNCVHVAVPIPFRSVKLVPLNTTVNITNKDMELFTGGALTNLKEASNITDKINVTVSIISPVNKEAILYNNTTFYKLKPMDNTTRFEII